MLSPIGITRNGDRNMWARIENRIGKIIGHDPANRTYRVRWDDNTETDEPTINVLKYQQRPGLGAAEKRTETEHV